jgi:hypothetical protein
MAQEAQAKQTISFLEVLRRNRVGNLVSGLVVMFAAALLLSAAVPSDLNIVIEILLILLLAAAVGFAVRVTSPDQGVGTLVTAAFLAGVGTPILFVTGSDPGSFGTALLASFGSGYLQVAAALAAIVAVICAGWGKR